MEQNMDLELTMNVLSSVDELEQSLKTQSFYPSLQDESLDLSIVDVKKFRNHIYNFTDNYISSCIHYIIREHCDRNDSSVRYGHIKTHIAHNDEIKSLISHIHHVLMGYYFLSLDVRDLTEFQDELGSDWVVPIKSRNKIRDELANYIYLIYRSLVWSLKLKIKLHDERLKEELNQWEEMFQKETISEQYNLIRQSKVDQEYVRKYLGIKYPYSIPSATLTEEQLNTALLKSTMPTSGDGLRLCAIKGFMLRLYRYHIVSLQLGCNSPCKKCIEEYGFEEMLQHKDLTNDFLDLYLQGLIQIGARERRANSSIFFYGE